MELQEEKDLMGQGFDTVRDLRSALLPWTIISLLVGVLLFIVSGLIQVHGANGQQDWLSPLLSSIGSAAVSVGVALLITEYILKPLYVRDLIQVAKLSSDVHQAGITGVERFNRLDISEFLSPGVEIDIAGKPELVRHIWPSVLEWASHAKGVVNLHLPSHVPAETWRDFETTWKQRDCESHGSSLTITDAFRGPSVFTLLSNSQCLVAVSDGAVSASNPLVLTFTLSRSIPYVHSVQGNMQALRAPVPLYVTSREK